MKKFILKTLLCVITSIYCTSAFASEKDIVIIESYNKNFRWDIDYCSALKEKLGQKFNLIFYEMDTKRIAKSKHEKMAINAWQLIKKINPAIVVLGDDAALKFIGPKLEENKIRSVYLGINNNPRVYFKNAPKYITGVLERPLIKNSAIFVKDLIPKAKKVLIMFDNDRTSEIVFEDFFAKKNSVVFSGIQYDFLLIKTFSEWQKQIINAAGTYDAVIIGLYQALENENGKNVDAEKVINWSSFNTKVPLFAFWDFAVGKNKTLGGLVLTGFAQGKAAAELVEKLTENPSIIPNSIFPVYLQEGIFLFSNIELKKYNLNLPAEIKKESKFVD